MYYTCIVADDYDVGTAIATAAAAVYV